jgi:hypothetical protein
MKIKKIGIIAVKIFHPLKGFKPSRVNKINRPKHASPAMLP